MNTLTRLCASEHLALPSFDPSSNPRAAMAPGYMKSQKAEMPAPDSSGKKRAASVAPVPAQRRTATALDLYAPQMLPKSDHAPVKKEAILATVLVCLTIVGSIFASNIFHRYHQSSVASSNAAGAVTALRDEPRQEIHRPSGVGCDSSWHAARTQPPAQARHDVSHVFPRIRAAKY